MTKLLVSAALAASALALPQNAHLAKSYINQGRAPKSLIKKFSVAMPMRDFPGLDKKLSEISDPYHPTYGQWLTMEEANVYTATPEDIKKEVIAWATSTGAQCKVLPESLKCQGTVAAVEELLDTELSVFMHKTRGTQIIRRSTAATVPAHLEGKVVMVTGLSQFPVPREGNSRPIQAFHINANGDYYIVPQTMETLYNLTYDGAASTTQAAVEFQDYPAPLASDLSTFLPSVGAPVFALETANIIGPYAPGDGADESTLDVQYLGAIGQGNTNWYWTESDWQYEFAQDLQTQNPVPSVLSMSYAWYELDQCDISPNVAPCENQPVPTGSAIFVNAVNQLFAKATATGITLLAASGDSGAHGRTDEGCSTPQTRAAFPSSSPYVTSVGATELVNGVTGNIPSAPICASTLQCATTGYEVVSSYKTNSLFSSGGGFSEVAAQPAWQATVVNKYLQNTTAVPVGDFNASGRAAPDVAALGHMFYVELDGSPVGIDGTSAATPSFAGVIANINANRAANGKPVVGFANPLLYAAYAANPLSFNDVVQGDNQCPEAGCSSGCTGFFAAPGYDATTGLGTPNYGLLIDTITKMGI